MSANPIVLSTTPASKFVDPNSRYINSQVFQYGENSYVTFETYKRVTIPSTNGDKYMIIPKNAEYRPDLIAYQAYSVPGLWWRILEANGMMDIWEFKAGVNIRIPNII